jgi:CRP-like cAMP-binding protein
MDDISIRKSLTDCEFFSVLGKEYLDLLSGNAKERRIEAGNIVFRQGEHADTFYLLLSGRITVEIPSVYGPSIEIQNLGAGQVLGWSWLISPYQWEFQAKALEDTVMLEFDGKSLLEDCENNPKFGYKLLSSFSVLMSQRLHASRQRMMDEWNPAGFA